MKKYIFRYLKFWAKGYLHKAKPEIVAITGSVGKTSAKEAIFEVLKVKFNGDVRKSVGNLNTETGVPLAILGYEKSPRNLFGWLGVFVSAPFRRYFLKSAKVIVLELAADKPGDIKYLTSFVKPKIAVLTAVGPSHLLAFGTIDKIVEEKTSLFNALSEDGWAVVNLDNEHLRNAFYQEKMHKNKKGYAFLNDADVTASNIKTEIQNSVAKTSFEINFGENKKVTVSQPTLGVVANISAALAAATVGLIYDMDPTDIAKGLSLVKNEKHRMAVLAGKNNTTIIDDSYNASPQSMKAALSTLKNLSGYNRKIAVIGDMSEIGSISDEAHAEIGQMAKETADLVVAVGGEAEKYQAQEYFRSVEEATEFLLKNIRPNDIILIKASRVIGLDKIAEAIKS